MYSQKFQITIPVGDHNLTTFLFSAGGFISSAVVSLQRRIEQKHIVKLSLSILQCNTSEFENLRD
jgi:hypothetical protein